MLGDPHHPINMTRFIQWRAHGSVGVGLEAEMSPNQYAVECRLVSAPELYFFMTEVHTGP